MSQKVELATAQDGERLLELMEATSAKGKIELIYTRRPNAYLSYQREGGAVKVLKVVENEQIIGSVAKITREMYIDGERERVCYLCGLKKDESYAGNINWGKAFLRSVLDEECHRYICSVLSDNDKAKNMAKKVRRHTVNFELLTEYTTYIIAPYFQLEVKENHCAFRQANKNDEKILLEFLNSEGSKKNMFPVFKSINQFADLCIKDFYILEDKGKIAAVGALWNQTQYKQYVVKKYNGAMRFARALNPLLKRMGYITLPRENEGFDFPMLSFFISRNEDENYYKVFLNNIVEVIKKQYGMFVVGTAKEYFANDIYKKLKSINFKSQIYAVHLVDLQEKRQNIKTQNIWLECGLL
ncbi:MAG: hypothetical protein IJR47_00415 [Clostridia bacterium]|nr:hypothetical protein [Clostridia bacterium]